MTLSSSQEFENVLDAWMEEFHFYLTFDDAALAPATAPDRPAYAPRNPLRPSPNPNTEFLFCNPNTPVETRCNPKRKSLIRVETRGNMVLRVVASPNREGPADAARAAVCANINLFMELNEEEFAKYLGTFAQDVWTQLTRVTLAPGQVRARSAPLA